MITFGEISGRKEKGPQRQYTGGLTPAVRLDLYKVWATSKCRPSLALTIGLDLVPDAMESLLELAHALPERSHRRRQAIAEQQQPNYGTDI